MEDTTEIEIDLINIDHELTKLVSLSGNLSSLREVIIKEDCFNSTLVSLYGEELVEQGFIADIDDVDTKDLCEKLTVSSEGVIAKFFDELSKAFSKIETLDKNLAELYSKKSETLKTADVSNIKSSGFSKDVISDFLKSFDTTTNFFNTELSKVDELLEIGKTKDKAERKQLIGDLINGRMMRYLIYTKKLGKTLVVKNEKIISSKDKAIRGNKTQADHKLNSKDLESNIVQLDKLSDEIGMLKKLRAKFGAEAHKLTKYTSYDPAILDYLLRAEQYLRATGVSLQNVLYVYKTIVLQHLRVLKSI